MRGEFRLDSNLLIILVWIAVMTLAFQWTLRRAHARHAEVYLAAIEAGEARSVTWYQLCGRGVRKVLAFEGSNWCIDRSVLDRIAALR